MQITRAFGAIIHIQAIDIGEDSDSSSISFKDVLFGYSSSPQITALKYLFYFLTKIYVVGTQKNRLNIETGLLSTTTYI